MLGKLEFLLSLVNRGFKVSPADRPGEATLDRETVTKWYYDKVELTVHGLQLKPEWEAKAWVRRSRHG
jgi:hypothetical protein